MFPIEILVAINAMFIMGLILLGRSRHLGMLAGSLPNALLHVASLLAIILIDFLVAFYDLAHGRSLILSNYRINDDAVVQQALSVFTSINFGLLAGIGAAFAFRGSQSGQHTRESAPGNPDNKRAARTTFFLFLICACLATLMTLLYATSHGSIFYARATSQTFYAERPELWIPVLCLIPALALMLTYEGKLTSIGVLSTLISLFILLATGSRNQMVFIVLVGLMLLHRHKFRLQAWLMIPATVGILVAGTLVQYVQRVNLHGITLQEFLYKDDTPLVLSLFQSPDISFAEVISMAVERPDVSIPPFSGFLGAAVFPIPRALLPQKPEQPSAIFTRAMDPLRWSSTGSGLTVSGYGELFLEFGSFAPIVAFVIGMAWGQFVRRCGERFNSGLAPLGAAYASWWAFSFLRGDAYILGFSLWPLIIVLTTFLFVKICLGRTGTTPSRSPVPTP